MKMTKGPWIQGQCQEGESCLRTNNSKKAHTLAKDLTTEKQDKSTTIQDKSGKCFTEENEILNRRTEYCSDLYNYKTHGIDGWVRVLRPFNSISVISRRWNGEHERLCAMKRHLGSGRISPSAGFEPATPWSEVGNANRSVTRTLLRLMGTQQYLTAHIYQMKSITLFHEKRLKQQSKWWRWESQPAWVTFQRTESSQKQKRSLLKSKQVSEPEGAPQSKHSISGSSVRNTCSISRISTMPSGTSRRHLTRYGTKPYRQLWGNTTSTPTSYESLKICMTRSRVQSCSMAVQETGSELQ